MSELISPPTLTSAQKTQIQNALAVLKPYLKVMITLYIQASTTRRVAFRAHNQTLDRFLTFMENCGVTF